MPSQRPAKRRPRTKKKLLRKISLAARARVGALPRKKKAPAVAAASLPPSTVVSLKDPLQRLLRAATFASQKHDGQRRADGAAPYFSHVVRVTLVLSQGFGVYDDEVLTAALLHDTVEDTATHYDEIAGQFGVRVADYVMLLTKNAMLPKKAREEDYEERLCGAPEVVKIAKMADLYDNLSTRLNSPKLRKTAETAGRLLERFEALLKSERGRQAHRKLGRLLEEIATARGRAATA